MEKILTIISLFFSIGAIISFIFKKNYSAAIWAFVALFWILKALAQK